MTRARIDTYRASTWPMVAAVAWLAAVSAGMWILLIYAGTPGDSGEPPETWPADSAIPPPTDRPVLLLMAHPRCPCTRATLGELARLMAHCGDRVQAHVLFLRPTGVSADWWKTDLWESANAIPGVDVTADDDGAESRHFHVATSGHVLLYGPDGGLLFSGGITPARGHEGENSGLEAVMHAIESRAPAIDRSLVFGCALITPTVGISGGRAPWKP